MHLEKISQPSDLRKLDNDQLKELAGEMRLALLSKISKKGGHFGPNFGIVEATIALHYVFDSPKDKIVFDVSHQSYCHKMLTGRRDAFLFEDNYSEVSGFTNPSESEHDFFEIGHTSTSISLACGLAIARNLKGDKENVIAVIGDGSLSGGEALEGLDFAAELKSNFIIVVNDNQMSIAENYGGLYDNLTLLRETDGKAECNLFRAMSLDYVFVKDGNDISQLMDAFRQVKDSEKPTVVHICTQKGKGYIPALEDKEKWHWTMPFDPETGETTIDFQGEDYGTITADFLQKKMKEDKTVVGITSGTPTVMGFTKDRRELAGSQFIDVGIAEETAVAIASGIAANGGKPVYGVYSTFIQRTFDQLSQDLCINKNAATILVYAASIYGMSDVTHLGIFDIPLISNIPNMVYLAPVTKEEYLAMVEWSITNSDYPVAIRVPGGDVISTGKVDETDYSKLNQYKVMQSGSDIAILALGSFYDLGEKAAKEIENRTGKKPTIINPVFITGTDDALLEKLKEEHKVVVTLEDGMLDGGFGEKIARFYGTSQMKVLNYGFKKEFLDRYEVSKVLEANRLTPSQIAEDAINF